LISFLADRTAGSVNRHHGVVCLSVCPQCCALWVNDTAYSKTVWASE